MACYDEDSASESEGEDARRESQHDIQPSPENTPQDGPISPGGNGGSPCTSKPGRTMATRAYQLEMLGESLERNIIVSMDTGSGKTQVAVLRIRAELDRTTSDKRIWFLAPTVSLCAQQFDVISSQIPSANSKLFIGEDDVSSWKDQKLWDAALENVRVVVCPYQVLLDAMSHGLVSLESISLIIFDEAHNCAGKHSGRRIMTERYWPAKTGHQPVPCILGLTASPVMRSNIAGLNNLEQTLDAVCRSPTVHRDELLSYVEQPLMLTETYSATATVSRFTHTASMKRLHQVVENLPIEQDPDFLRLASQGTPRSQRALKRALMSHRLPNKNQLRRFCRTSVAIARVLGSWAVDFYIHQTIRRVSQPLDGWDDDDVGYMGRVLGKVGAERPVTPFPTHETASSQLQALVRVLERYEGEPVGIVFVKERATAAVLSRLLSTIPSISERYRIGCLVGRSRFPGIRQDFYQLPFDWDERSLEQFRGGKINLLVATSVLEEGIDVPACNLVICFEAPANLKSFIQRRGRARMRRSHLFLLLDDQSRGPLDEWAGLEAEMRQRYEDDMRELNHIKELEALEGRGPEMEPLRNQNTGAQITVDDAKSHLEHFCRKAVNNRQFVDPSPEYIISKCPQRGLAAPDCPLLKATVLLPVSLPPEVRWAEGSKKWLSERRATQDAAFQAYKKLYRAGLLNDKLLPVTQPKDSRDVEGRSSTDLVQEQYNPWPKVIDAWRSATVDIHRRRLQLLDHRGSLLCESEVLLPVPFPDVREIALFWTPSSPQPWTVTLDTDLIMSDAHGSGTDYATGSRQTEVLLGMSFGHRDGFSAAIHNQPVLFTHPGLDGHDGVGSLPFSKDEYETSLGTRLVRDAANHPYIYERWLPCKPALDLVRKRYKGLEEDPEDIPYVVVREWPRKCGLFHKVKNDEGGGGCEGPSGRDPPSGKPYRRVLPAGVCKIDTIPMVLGQLSTLVPSITHVLGNYLVATELLGSTDLGTIGISDVSLVVAAISSRGAKGPTDYERIEFLGDSILKLCTSVACAANYLTFPEGYLSLMKDRVVSNSRLCKAAVKFGLDAFILTSEHTEKRWRDHLSNVPGSGQTEEKSLQPHRQHDGGTSEDTPGRKLSTKTLADVVEALIGAFHIDGGLTKAQRCVSLLLPDVEWTGVEHGREILCQAAAEGVTLPSTLKPLEEMLGYTFSKKALLIEAMTHSSYNMPGTAACLERLEFLGDSILDHIVVGKLFTAREPPLAHFDMHLLRTALVNGDFLAFLAMEWTVKRRRHDVVRSRRDRLSRLGPRGFTEQDNSSTEAHSPRRDQKRAASSDEEPSPAEIVDSEFELPLWSFMRHMSGELGREQKETMLRHTALRGQIRAALDKGERYPWDLLARLQAQKVYSDVFEAVVGAVWVDSGSVEECERLVERAGILPYLRRAVADGVRILHPKEELGRLADDEKVVYTAEEVALPQSGARLTLPPKPVFRCSVSVGGRCVARIQDGVSSEEAKTRAAQEAVRRWEECSGKFVALDEDKLDEPMADEGELMQ